MCGGSQPAEIDAAISSAAAAFPARRDTSLAKRQTVMFAFRNLLDQRAGELAQIITPELGRVLSDPLGKISRGQEVAEFVTGLAHLLQGEYGENVSTDVDVCSTRQPLGVVGVISPCTFPAMVPTWFFPIAIAAGNTVILKPSDKDPRRPSGSPSRERKPVYPTGTSACCTVTRRLSTGC